MKRRYQIEQQRAVNEFRQLATKQNPSIQMALPLTELSHFSVDCSKRLGVSQVDATRVFGNRCGEDLATSVLSRDVSFCCFDVFAKHKPEERRQGSSVLQRG
jgi:hypothetical protein